MVLKKYFSLLLLCTCIWTPSWSQEDAAETIGRWYLEQRFFIADNDLDETLDAAEINMFPREFSYYLNGNHYTKCDLNHDGILSRGEINQHAREEWKYRLSAEESEIERLKQEYPILAIPDASTLQTSPGLVQQLVSNYAWASQHPELVFEVMSDRSWVAKNPQIIKTFHTNLRWLTDFPQYALRFYMMRDWGSHAPEFREWRKNHQAFLSAHSEWATGKIHLVIPEFIHLVALDITDNNSRPTPEPLIPIENSIGETSYEGFNHTILEDSIRILQAQLAQERLNAQRNQQKFASLQDQIKNAEYEQSTHLSQMRSERETLITTTERQRKEIEVLNRDLLDAEERLNQYIDLTSSGSDAMRDEAVQLKSENKKLRDQLSQFDAQKTQLTTALRQTETDRDALPSQLAAYQTNAPQLVAIGPTQTFKQDSLIAANLQLEQDITRLARELSSLAEAKSNTENERDNLMLAQAATKKSQLLRVDSLLNTSRQQSEDIRNLSLQLNAMQESYETQLQKAYATVDSVAALNQMLSSNQAEMKSDLKRLVRENAALASNAAHPQNTSPSASNEQAKNDSLLFETTRRQREVALLRTEMEQLRSRLNESAQLKAPETGATASTQASLQAKQLEEKNRQLEQMTDKFIAMAAEVKQARTAQQKFAFMRDSLLASVAQERNQIGALRQSLQKQAATAPHQTDSLNQLLQLHRQEIATLKAERQEHVAYARRSRMVFDSLVALTSRLPELEAGRLSAVQAEQSLSQAEVDLSKAEKKIAELEFERQKLQEQVDLALMSHATTKDEFESRVETAQATIRELSTEVKRLKTSSEYYSQQSNQQQELYLLRQQVSQLEQKNLAMQKQLGASNQYVDERLTTLDRLSAEVQTQKAEIAQLTAVNRTLNARLSTDMVSREVHTDSLTYFRSKVIQLSQQIQALGKQRLNDQEAAHRQIESLEHQITQIEMKYAGQSRITQIDEERLAKIKQQETELQESLASIDERERLLRQQETYIMGRLNELDKKENRYQHLLQLETELRLLEQRLKQYPNYDQMRNDVSKEAKE